MSALNVFASVMKDVGIKESDRFLPVSSGFYVLDMFNAQRFKQPAQNPEINDGEEVILGGISSLGNNLYVTGYTGVGKTTLSVQMAMQDVAKFDSPYAHVFHFDLERAFDKTRVASITGMTKEQVKRYFTTVQPTAIEDIYTFIKKISHQKIADFEAGKLEKVYHPDTGELMYPPTYFIIDTVAALRSKASIDREEMGSMLADPGQQAKANNRFFAEVPYMGLPNITVISINHIRQQISTGPVKQTSKVQYMNHDETTPGGTGAQQYADTWLRLSGGSKIKEDESLGFHGSIVKVRLVKSRNAPAGREFEMIYVPSSGYSDHWSMLQYMRGEKLLKGAGAHLYVETADGRTTRKFALRNFEKLWIEDEEFRETFFDAFYENIQNVVPELGADIDALSLPSEEVAEVEEPEEETAVVVPKVTRRTSKKK